MYALHHDIIRSNDPSEFPSDAYPLTGPAEVTKYRRAAGGRAVVQLAILRARAAHVTRKAARKCAFLTRRELLLLSAITGCYITTTGPSVRSPRPPQTPSPPRVAGRRTHRRPLSELP
ncbi:hypothetical protein EVAR_80025_1 [Eumeta japonica]|uniref:Uncharacterized protein n=1 Tax=Eumeta variegata TaxID=151549 RepID=A0A4C1WM58_EUMVA|nr:hypothetical protein EVAR_80025_1 [Eumeta japonica]